MTAEAEQKTEESLESKETQAASGKPVIKVTKADLPACCPPKDQAHWNQHPRVYLELTDGSASCPYCGNHFVLAEG